MASPLTVEIAAEELPVLPTLKAAAEEVIKLCSPWLTEDQIGELTAFFACWIVRHAMRIEVRRCCSPTS